MSKDQGETALEAETGDIDGYPCPERLYHPTVGTYTRKRIRLFMFQPKMMAYHPGIRELLSRNKIWGYDSRKTVDSMYRVLTAKERINVGFTIIKQIPTLLTTDSEPNGLP